MPPSVLASLVFSETRSEDKDTDTTELAPSAKPAISEHILPQISSSEPPPHEPVRVFATGSTVTVSKDHELREDTDEVQNFLARYAKTYGPKADFAVTHPSMPPKALPLVSPPLENLDASVHAGAVAAVAAPERSKPKSKPGARREEKYSQMAAKPESDAAKTKRKDGTDGKKLIKQRKPSETSKPHLDSNLKFNAGDADGVEGSNDRPGTRDGFQAAATSVESVRSLLSNSAPSLPESIQLISSASQALETNKATQNLNLDTASELAVGVTSVVDSHFADLRKGNLDEPEGTDAPELPLPNLGSTSVSLMLEPKIVTPPPEPDVALPRKKSKAGASASDKGKQKLLPSQVAGPSVPLPSRKAPAAAATKPSGNRKASVEPRGDDMFERKKRDNYLQKGLDLTAHSSRRFMQKSGAPSSTVVESDERDAGCVATNTNSKTPTPEASVSGPGASRSTETVSQLVVTGKKKHKAPAYSSLDPGPDDHKQRASAESLRPSSDIGIYSNSRSSQTGKSISNHGDRESKRAFSSSRLGRTQSQLETSLEAEEPTNTSSSSIGNVIAERLAHFSHRILGSFGLLSSQTETSSPSSGLNGVDLAPAHLPGPDYQSHHSSGKRGHDSRWQTSPLLLSELSPRKQRQVSPVIAQADAVIVRHNPGRPGHVPRARHQYTTEADAKADDKETPSSRALANEHDIRYHSDIAADVDSQPLRVSRKRPAGDAIEEVMGFELSERNPKRSKLSRNCVIAPAGTTASSSQANGIQEISSLTRSRTAKGKTGGRGLLATSRSKPAPAAGRRSAVPEASQINKHSKGPSTAGSERTKHSCSLTVPMAPTFAGDILRQQRTLVSSERDQNAREKRDQGKGKLSKSDGVVTASSACAKVLLDDKPETSDAPPKPTVLHTFQFETDKRSMARRQEFKDKIKTWEKRAAAGASACSKSNSHKPIPDFKSIHAIQEANLAGMAAQRREFIVPTVPVSPHFLTDIRLLEREKFDEARRLREKEIERMIEEKRREREEEQERELREARKRAVPRANAVPEWYADAPKRSAKM
ncbi:hypothetical protein EW145_g2688 [Phellinidium pouzarii]|uniref:TPX2 C-terminal domain-containing protein n=1 Tax=Phellinidium pouzarii TaxID=167371 RepID=A0A4S4LA48_9AGAM|nr:hypothetical protein EW145_g2688 [Phellinidium pouzarii]